jgi:hypothetical protein
MTKRRIWSAFRVSDDIQTGVNLESLFGLQIKQTGVNSACSTDVG